LLPSDQALQLKIYQTHHLQVNKKLILTLKAQMTLSESKKMLVQPLYSTRNILPNEKGFPHEKVFISVGVQKMVNSGCAGVMFTINPVTGNKDEIVIEGNYGLGETVVSGVVNPDDFVVDKATEAIKERRIERKTIEYIRDPKTGKTVHLDVPRINKK
jgi:pyruvate,water dikinase